MVNSQNKITFYDAVLFGEIMVEEHYRVMQRKIL